MNVNDLIILNFEEVRHRSIKVWKAVPEHKLNRKTVKNAKEVEIKSATKKIIDSYTVDTYTRHTI